MLAAHSQEDIKSKPYFLQGLLHARSILEAVKASKQEEIQLSPIRRGHTKMSNEPIAEDDEEPYSPHQSSMVVHHQDSQGSNNINQANREYNGGFMRDSVQGDVRSQIETYRRKINALGSELEDINGQIESYEIVFNHLCDCYQANLPTVHKHHKLKRDSLRLSEQRAEIREKTRQLQATIDSLEHDRKKANEFVCAKVQEYLGEVMIYNLEEDFLNQLPPNQIKLEGFEDKNSSDEEKYVNKLRLNFKQFKKDKEEHMQKKVLLEPKKLQKGVSFEQEIDVISRYYEDELSNI